MKKIISLIVIIIILAAIAVAIRSASDNPAVPSDDQGRVRAPEEMTLKVGEEKEIAGVDVKLNSIVSDSRCGTDTLCIQAGNVTVNVTLATGGVSTTTNMIDGAHVSPLLFEGYEISIPRVAPARFASSTFTPDQYSITFRVAPTAQEPSVGKVNGNPTDFGYEGYISFVKQGATVDAAVFTYATGTASSTVNLAFDELSFCAAQNGAEQCIALNVPLSTIYNGKHVLLEGISLDQGQVLVRKMWVITPGEMVLPTTGNVYVSWEQARNFIQSCALTSVVQTHRLDVIMDIKGGTKLRTVEPVADEVFKVLEASKAKCGNVPIGME